jgi:hypothetical protein
MMKEESKIKSSYTPGPWIVSPRGGVVLAKADECGCIATMHKHPLSNNSEQEANARLIAAAPELLEALKAFLTEDSAGFPASNMQVDWQARAVIAKVENK